MSGRTTIRPTVSVLPEDWERIRQAAEAAGESVSAYVVAAALARAESGDAPLTPAEVRRFCRRVEGALR